MFNNARTAPIRRAAGLSTPDQSFIPVTAAPVVKAIDKRVDKLYVPFQWQPIIFVVRNIPDCIFKKLNL